VVEVLRTAIKARSKAGMTLGATSRRMLSSLTTQTGWTRRQVRSSARRSARELQYWKDNNLGRSRSEGAGSRHRGDGVAGRMTEMTERLKWLEGRGCDIVEVKWQG
jgi:hypothetical protein